MRLGIGELQLQKKGLLLEIHSLAKISCLLIEEILLRLLRSLLPSTTNTAASDSLSPNFEGECVGAGYVNLNSAVPPTAIFTIMHERNL